MREMHCACAFHDPSLDQTIVGYRRDLPTLGKPLTAYHGHVCSTCARFYHRPVRAVFWMAHTLDEYVSWVLHPKSILLPDEIVAIHAPRRSYAILIVCDVKTERKAA